MNYEPATDDRILRELLRRTDTPPASPAAEPPPDFDELFGQFIEGTLAGGDRELFLARLDADPARRRIVADYLKLQAEAETKQTAKPPARAIPAGRPAARAGWMAALAVAASLLAAVGVMLWIPAEKQTEPMVYNNVVESLVKSRFEDAERSIAAAQRRGIDSARLRNLQAQSVLEIPAVVSLDARGSMLDFDFELGGLTPRSAGQPSEEERKRLERAGSMLETSVDGNEAALLNLGFVLLRQRPDRPGEAKALFQQVIEANPNSSRAWLGRGIASYMEDAFAEVPPADALQSAASDFRRSLQLDPEFTEARINLAMALTERSLEQPELIEQALKEWKKIDLTRVENERREQIRLEIGRLERIVGD